MPSMVLLLENVDEDAVRAMIAAGERHAPNNKYWLYGSPSLPNIVAEACQRGWKEDDEAGENG